MNAAGLLLALALTGPEPFLPHDFAPPGDVERRALLRCTEFWLDHISAEAATGTCACYVRGLRQQAGEDGIPASWLASWPRRTAGVSKAFAACFEFFVARDLAACTAESIRAGDGEAGCCGSGGCLDDFARMEAYRSGYWLLDNELGEAKGMPRRPWAVPAQRTFLKGCAGRGFRPRRCACYLQVARIELTEQNFLARGDADIYDPPNAFDDIIEMCDIYHRREKGKKITPDWDKLTKGGSPPK